MKEGNRCANIGKMLFSDCAFKTHELVASTCYILQFYYDKNTNSAQAHRIKTVYCLQSSIVMEKTEQTKFSRFRSRSFDVKDAADSGLWTELIK